VLLLLGSTPFWAFRDRTGPAIVISGPELTQATTTIQLGASEAATFLCELDDQPRAACSSPLELSGLSDGPHVLTAWAVDDAGNEGEAGTWRWIVDTTPPSVKVRVKETGADTAVIRITVDDAEASVGCTLNAQPHECTPTGATLTDLSPGQQIFRVRATDLAGNESETADERWLVEPGGSDPSDPGVSVPSNLSIPSFTCDSDSCTASAGEWTGEPTYTYAWQENCDSDLSGNGCTDALVTGQEVPRLCGYARVGVTGRNAAGESERVYSDVGASNLMC
jgi:hypothetical protein